MNMRKPIVIEFTGPPNSGKTTILRQLPLDLIKYGISAEVAQEDAEIVPLCIPKKTWIRNVWITLGQLQTLLETKYSNSDFMFLDRGLFDAMFWAEFLQKQSVCTKEESEFMLRFLDDLNSQFDLTPDCLFVVDISTEESLRRRYKQNNEQVVLSTNEFIDSYKAQLDSFCSNLKTDVFRLDTTDLTLEQMSKLTLAKIFEIYEKY